jgi:hypothetical protein
LDIQYTTKCSRYYSPEETVTESIEEFIYNSLIKDDNERLENQPKLVCKALGRLIDRLVQKGVLDLEDLKEISYTCRDNLEIKEG